MVSVNTAIGQIQVLGSGRENMDWDTNWVSLAQHRTNLVTLSDTFSVYIGLISHLFSNLINIVPESDISETKWTTALIMQGCQIVTNWSYFMVMSSGLI